MAPQPSQFLLVCSLTLSACSYLTVLWLAIKRPPNAPYPRARWLGVSFVVGSAAGGILVWNLMPALLPFWQTVRAALDANHYGHAFEHAAESVLTVLVFVSLLAGATTAVALILISRRFQRGYPRSL